MDQQPTEVSTSEKLNIMATEAGDLAGQKGFMNPGAERKKRGRPRKDQGAGPQKPAHDPIPGSTVNVAPPIDPIAELMPLTTALATFYSQFLVQIAEDERVALTKDKHQLVAHTSAVCLNQYMPGVLGKHASAIVLIVTIAETSFVAYRLRMENLARLRKEYSEQKARASQEGKAPNGQAGSPVFPQ